ncbi:MAG TPA: hypothetical protein VF604_19755 [Pyrinomonadaceae bacterium]|jgi:hypothetical protein
MRALYENPYFYSVLLDEKTGEYFLEVTCGRAAVFLFRIKLRKNEIEEFLENENALEPLAFQIMDAPDSFLKRKI